MVIVISATFMSISHANNAEIRVLIDGNAVEFDVAPQIISGRTLVPMRAIFEALGAEVEWDAATQTVIARTRWEQVVRLTVGSTEISIDGIAFQMDIAPIIQNGRTLVPARFVAQTLGYEVYWDAANSDVLINTNPFIRLNPEPVTLTTSPLSWRDLGSWIIYYLDSGGMSEFEREVVRFTNIMRERNGVPTLAICEVLSAAARFKSQEMSDLEYIAHVSPVYGQPYVIPNALFGATHFTGENLAFFGEGFMRGLSTTEIAEKLVQEWYNSPGHRANMLDRAHNVIGVGVVDYYGLFGTQMFGFLSPGETATPIMTHYIQKYIYLFGE